MTARLTELLVPVVVLLVLLAVGACRSAPTEVGLRGVHPLYQPSFEAVRHALEEGDDALARYVLSQLRTRLDVDLSTAPTLEEAEAGGTPASELVALGQVPPREAVEAAISVADGFERVLEGRALIAELDLRLEVRRVPDVQEVEILLVGVSRSTRSVVLRPGPASLAVERSSIEPNSGQEQHAGGMISLPKRLELALPAGGTAELVLGNQPIGVPSGALATRSVYKLVLRAGDIDADGVTYPAQVVVVAPAERTDLPSWLPSSPVEPTELGRLAALPEAGLPALLERTVRILPDRRNEALDQLALVVDVSTPDEVERLVPSLRWLSGTDAFGRDPAAWKAWAEKRPWTDERSLDR